MNDNSIIPPQKKLEVIKNNLNSNQELTEIKTDFISEDENESQNRKKTAKKLNKRKKKAPQKEKNDVNTIFKEDENIEEIAKIQKKKPRTKTKKSSLKKLDIKSNNKSKVSNSKNIMKEKIIELETNDNQTEIREIKSSSPIEVTQIDENSSSAKPKKKGWWSQ